MATANTRRSNRPTASKRARRSNGRRPKRSEILPTSLAQLSSNRQKSVFARSADWAAHTLGSPSTFVLATAVVVVWAISGPLFGFSDTWQLVINTGTTIVTFLMVFLVQATQNRDTAAFHLKLDEIIRSHHGAKNELLDMEQLTIEELEELRSHYEKLADKARRKK